MKRENAGAKPTPSPKLPPEAAQEILEALFEGMEIHSSEIAAILKKHGVCGDVEALQDSYHYIRVDTITIAAPDWYDGLVMVFPTQPDTWEESKAYNELFSELDDYYPALDLPWDVESALNCLVLW